MTFSFIMKVACECTNKDGMIPEKGNPLVDNFRKLLENIKFKDELPEDFLLEGSIQNISNFEANQPTPNVMQFSWDLNVNVVDNAPKSLTVERFNNSTKPRIAKVIGRQELQENGSICRIIGIDYR